MTHEEVMAVMEEIGLPYAYHHLRKGNPLIRLLQYSCIREATISLQTGKSILRQTV